MKVHQIWIDDIIPEKIQQQMLTWKNSGYEYQLWRKEDLKIYEEEFNNSGMRIYHNSLQSDLYRLLVLRDYAGIYVDCDSTLKGTLPKFQKTCCACINGDPLMPDPWFIYAAYTNDDQIIKILNDGLKMANDIDPLHRFGYKAFTRKWTSDVIDMKAWIIHANNFSWKQHNIPATTRRT